MKPMPLPKLFAAIAVCAALSSVGCGGDAASLPARRPAAGKETTSTMTTRAEDRIKISIGGRVFEAALEDSPSARALAAKLPLDVTMTELNGNEKYHRFDERLPSNDSAPGKIRAGDLMLYSGSCVVLFYKDHPTSYNYTRLGRIENADGLAEAVGGGDVRVRFTR